MKKIKIELTEREFKLIDEAIKSDISTTEQFMYIYGQPSESTINRISDLESLSKKIEKVLKTNDLP